MHLGLAIWSVYKKGGLERSGVNWANAMAARGHLVTIFYKSQNKGPHQSAYPLSEGVTLQALNLHNDTDDGTLIRNQFEQCGLDVFVVFTSARSLLWFVRALHPTGIPLIISERNSPVLINEERWNAYERHACLYGADCIHTLLPCFVKDYPEFLQHKLVVIPNIAPHYDNTEHIPSASGRKILLGVGRLEDDVKQFHLLIKAFSSIAGDFPEWDLVIYGTGKLQNGLKKLASSLGLAGRAKLPGVYSNLAKCYGRGNLVCIPSRYEGHPNVPMEAHLFSLPVVGFAECPGVNEVVIHGENGILAPEMTAEALAPALATLMADEELRTKMGARGRELLSRYDASSIYDAWEYLLNDISKLKNRTTLQKYSSNLSQEILADIGLKEILHRKGPLVRCNNNELVALKKQLNTLKQRMKDKRLPWYRKLITTIKKRLTKMTA